MDQFQRFYDIFGLNPGATLSELKGAYRDLVRVWHPDRFGDDPRLQQKAQERLKEVNEAYRVLQKVLAEPPASPVRPPAATPSSAAAPGKPAARPQSATATAPPPSPDAVSRHWSIATFVAYWPNVLLLILLVATVRLANLRHGFSLAAIGYVLQMMVVPLLFAVVCNSRLGGRRTIWTAYLVMLTLVSILLVLDGLSLKKELQEASPSRYPVGEDLPFSSGGGLGQSPTAEPWRPVERKPSGGPMAPLEPNAPVVPPPVAPASPVAPSGR